MLDPTLSDWLDRQADALDRGDADPASRHPQVSGFDHIQPEQMP